MNAVFALSARRRRCRLRSSDPGNDGVHAVECDSRNVSMGPGSLDPGNHAGTYARDWYRLQWSRDHSIPEIRSAALLMRLPASMEPGSLDPGNLGEGHPIDANVGFNGAGITRSRKSSCLAARRDASCALQWSRDHSIPEISRDVARHSARLLASMEPGSLDPGNPTVRDAVTRARLQWSRDHSIPEMPRQTRRRQWYRLQWSRDHSIPEM